MSDAPEGWTQIADGIWAKDDDIALAAERHRPATLRVYPEPREFTPTELGERIRGADDDKAA